MDKADGKRLSRRYGVERPKAMKVKSIQDKAAGMVMAAARAGARNGAEQGVATIVARIPDAKDSASPELAGRLFASEMADVPNSKTPLKLSPNTKKRTISAKTNTGFCS